jgi:hypothetical protein
MSLKPSPFTSPPRLTELPVNEFDEAPVMVIPCEEVKVDNPLILFQSAPP